ncbi:uncharacterized protein MONBRDRAFT_32600 [Monosiga brevicollis MX1]|uniref:Rho-GAP domain-containing protein n=1 Tax=Monosiga brevicollis TaxID=81824 RepID=A9V0K8_MONBE|nr:uncharacterized protein MONBRDRAFT_32600 [Monosiga brevicollis MX1]EDQ89169.1 predicted protein [Monosiga brevicollis MX1]|eukprot:XP_001746274.1 hypothetical protein [Monosiga brevicollis MX1]
MLDPEAVAFLQRAIRVLEIKGLAEEGLYREPGDANVVRALVAMIKKKDVAKQKTALEKADHKDLCSAIKQICKDMQPPIIDNPTVKKLLRTIDSPEPSRMTETKAILAHLPTDNRAVLQVLLTHFHRVHLRSAQNRMSAAALSISLAPSLLPENDPTFLALQHEKFAAVGEYLIKHVGSLFNTVVVDLNEPTANGMPAAATIAPPVEPRPTSTTQTPVSDPGDHMYEAPLERVATRGDHQAHRPLVQELLYDDDPLQDMTSQAAPLAEAVNDLSLEDGAYGRVQSLAPLRTNSRSRASMRKRIVSMVEADFTYRGDSVRLLDDMPLPDLPEPSANSSEPGSTASDPNTPTPSMSFSPRRLSLEPGNASLVLASLDEADEFEGFGVIDDYDRLPPARNQQSRA